MRTLKKALSLVLVLAMVFTLAVPALAVDKASEFKDYAKVQNKEAVDVLTAIGVINGNPDGTFGAEGKFTRAQAATMIAYLTLGKTVADALPTSATKFSDVPASFWGAKYIQYCADEGIINGYGNGKFGPDDELTSTQWALMLLGALGYESNRENIGGSGWEIATTKLAMKAGVATADELTGAFNRDMAAKMALNTLQATMVEYKTTGTDITIGDTQISVGGSKASKVDQDGYTDTMGEKDTLQFVEKNFPKLTKTVGGKTAMGAPATTWKLNGKDIGVYGAAPVVSYTTKVTSGTLYSDLGLTKTTSLNVVKNGTATTTSPDAGTVSAEKNSKVVVIGGNGVMTSVYNKGTKDEPVYYVVETKAVLTKITAITSYKASSARGAYDAYSFENNAFNGKLYTTVVDAVNDKSEIVLNGEFEKNDWVLAYNDSEGVAYIYPVTVVTGVLTSINEKEVLTIDGTTYNLSGVEGAARPTVSKKEQSFYVDNYGNVIKSFTEVATNNAYVVPDTAKQVFTQGTGNVLETTYQVSIITMDGKVETVLTTESWNDHAGAIVKYTVNAKGQYVYSADADTEPVNALANDTATIGNLKANNDTLYVVLNTKKDDDQHDVFAGTVTTYTGYKNAPVFASGLKNSVAIDTDSPADNIADVVVIGDFTAAATEVGSWVYVTGKYNDTVNGKEYQVIVGGETSTVTKPSGDSLDADTLYSAIGATDVKAQTESGKSEVVAGAKVENKGGLLYINGTYKYGIADNVKVYTIDMADDSVSTITAGEMSGEFDTNFAGLDNVGTRGVYVELSNGSVASLYILFNSAD